jgi:hypothetical protein
MEKYYIKAYPKVSVNSTVHRMWELSDTSFVETLNLDKAGCDDILFREIGGIIISIKRRDFDVIEFFSMSSPSMTETGKGVSDNDGEESK